MPRAHSPARPVAVVTGAGRGIGLEIARRLAGDGHLVVCADLLESSAEAAATEIGGGAVGRAVDVRDPAALRELAGAAAAHGPVAVWVNNAGILRPGAAWQHAEADIDLMVATNFLGVVHGCRAALEVMDRGAILNIASLSSLGPVPGLAVYAATKAAVLSFSVALQGDLNGARRRKIRVHAMCPDGVNTTMVTDVYKDPGMDLIFTAPRVLTPVEVAEAAVGMLGTRRMVTVLPRWRGWLIRTAARFPRLAVAIHPPLAWVGRRRRASMS
jgi:NAD(P)-dependent dehydrogenase (short-subunit alcohol dehydrogenase family)